MDVHGELRCTNDTFMYNDPKFNVGEDASNNALYLHRIDLVIEPF